MSLRVIHVIDSLAASGGAENRLVDEVLQLSDRYEQVVVRLFERDTLEGRLRAAGIPVVALGFSASRAGWNWPFIVRRLRAMLRRERPDVLHTALFTGNLVGQLAAARLACPVLSTFNRTGDLSLQRELQAGVATWRGRRMQALGRWAAQRGDVHYRAVSAYTRRTNCASMTLPPEQATVVPRGVRMAPVDMVDDRSVFGLPAEVPLFVNVARRVPEKAQHLLVEAFAAVRAELPEAQLAIAGSPGPADPVIAEAVERHGVAPAVHLLGFRPDARALIRSADVFAFSSLSEGSPSAVVEALTLGTPVAAFGIGPVAELTDGGNHARLAPTGSSPALAKAMLEAHDDRDGARVASAQRWAERFSLTKVVADLAELLESRATAVPRPDRGGSQLVRSRPVASQSVASEP